MPVVMVVTGVLCGEEEEGGCEGGKDGVFCTELSWMAMPGGEWSGVELGERTSEVELDTLGGAAGWVSLIVASVSAEGEAVRVEKEAVDWPTVCIGRVEVPSDCSTDGTSVEVGAGTLGGAVLWTGETGSSV